MSLTVSAETGTHLQIHSHSGMHAEHDYAKIPTTTKYDTNKYFLIPKLNIQIEELSNYNIYYG